MVARAAQTFSVKLDANARGRIEQLAETVTAWEEYQEKGMHATAAEVEAWLASWGTDKELPTPACHT